MAYNPEIVIHEVRSGSVFDGLASNGLQEPLVQGAPYFNGRVQFFGQGTSGGRITSNASTGTFLSQIMFSGAGTTGFDCLIEGSVYPSSAPATFSSTLFSQKGGLVNLQSASPSFTDPESWVFAPVSPVFIPPGYSIVFKTSGNLTSDGRVTFLIGGSWGYRTLQQT